MECSNRRTFRWSLLFKSMYIPFLLSPAAMCMTFSLLAGPVLSAEVTLNLTANSVANKNVVDAAIAAAADYFNNSPNGAYIINFPTGTWKIHHPDTYGMHFRNLKTSAANPLILRGAGQDQTVIKFDQFDQFGMLFENTPFVTVEKMHLSRCRSTDPVLNPEDTGLYTTQGNVMSITPGHVIFRLHTGFPDPIWMMDNAVEGLETTLLGFTHEDPENPVNAATEDRLDVSEIISLPDSHYDAVLSDPAKVANLSLGDWVALKTKFPGTTVRTHDCDDFTIQDVLFTRASACPLMLLRGSDRGVVRRITMERVSPINGRAPCYSSPGGGPQIYADTEGPLVEDCYINATADDGIAVFSYAPSVQVMSNSVICNNTVNDVCGRGIIAVNCKDGLCSGNTIRRGRSWSVLLAQAFLLNDPSAAPCENWRIENNTFIQPWSYSVIGFHMTAEGFGRNDEIYIEDNIFIEAPKNNAMVDVDYCDHVYINNNQVWSFSAEEDVPGPDNRIPQPTAAMVYVSDSLNVSGTNNYTAEATGRIPFLVEPGNSGTVDVEWDGTDIVGSGGICLATEDARVIENAPNNNYGDGVELDVRAAPGVARRRYSYLKFNVADANLPIQSATLRIYSDDADMSVAAHAVANNSWSEDTITWNTKPALGAVLDTQTAAPGEWAEFDVSSHISGNGTFSIALAGAGTVEDAAALNFQSRETLTLPHLVLECASVTVTAQFYSVSSEDGYIVESGEDTDEGYSVTSDRDDATALRVGDTLNKKQWLSVVSFNTSGLEGARIVSATLKLTRASQTGDPSGFGDLLVDLKSGQGFSGRNVLEASDFEALADVQEVTTLNYPASNQEVASGALNWMGCSYINRSGKTQFRIRFETDDDNDSVNDYLGFYSGEYSTQSKRPVLEVVYEL